MKKMLFFVCMLMGLLSLHAQIVVGPARVTTDMYGFTIAILADSVEHSYAYPGSLVILSEEDGVTKFESIESFVHGDKIFKFLFLAKRLVRDKKAWWVITSTQLVAVEN